MAPSRVPLNRALSKLGILSRREATTAIRLGRVRVNGSVAVDPAMPVVPEQATVEIDGQPRARDRAEPLRAPRVALDKTAGRGSGATIERRGRTSRGVRRVFEAVGQETIR